MLREGRGIRQEDVAAAARRLGLPWTRATIAAIELGRRRLSDVELLSLPTVLSRVGVTVSDAEAALRRPMLRDLVPADKTWVALPRGRVRADFLAESAFGRRGDPRPELFRLQHRDHPAVTTDARRAWRRVWPDKPFDADLMALAEVDALGDTETKVAATLGVTPTMLALIARQRWGRTLTAERDRRLTAQGRGGDADPRTVQALRGHVTRELLDELRPLVKDIAKKGRPTR